MEKNLNKILWSVFVLIILGAIFCASSFGQINPTFKSVKLDSIRTRISGSDTIWLTDNAGSVAYIRIKQDSLIFGDASGEKYLSSLATGGTPGGSPGDIQYNSAGSFGGMNVSTDGNYMQFGASGTYIDSTIARTDTLVIYNAFAVADSVVTHTVEGPAFYLPDDSSGFVVLPGSDAIYGRAFQPGGYGSYLNLFDGGFEIGSNSQWANEYISSGFTDGSSFGIVRSNNTDSDAAQISLSTENTVSNPLNISFLLTDNSGTNNYRFYKDSLLAINSSAKFKDLDADTATAIKAKSDTTETDIIILASGDTIESRQDPQEWIEGTQFDSLDAILLKAGRVSRDTTYHAIGGFEDSTITVNCPVQSTWYHVTNATNNLVIGLDAQGFSISGDTLISNVSGDFRGGATITFSGTTGNEYQFRAYNVTQARQIGFKQGITANGTSVYRNLTLILYENLSIGDKIVLQVENITATNPAILRHYQFEAVYLHD